MHQSCCLFCNSCSNSRMAMTEIADTYAGGKVKKLPVVIIVKAASAAFCEKAKELDLLLVAADGFGSPGYVRISYCVDKDMIERSMTAFAKLAESYK